MAGKNIFQDTLVPKGAVTERGNKQIGMMRLSPQSKAVVDKLVGAVLPPRTDSYGQRETPIPTQNLIHKISETTATNVNDCEAIMQVLPDLKMVRQILISSILSPNDMIDTNITIGVDETDIDSKLVGAFVEIIDNFIVVEYKLVSKLFKILDAVLFVRGSYPIIIIPESSLDDLINSPERVSMEDIRSIGLNLNENGSMEAKGLLGPNDEEVKNNTKPYYISNENKKIYDFLGLETTVIDVHKSKDSTMVKINGSPIVVATDNPDVMKMPLIRKKFATDRADELLGVRGKKSSVSSKDVENIFYKHRQYRTNMSASIKTQDQTERRSVGHPLVLEAPSESMIPVHTPGNPSDHIGYFILLDQTGNPINRAEFANYYNDLSVNLSNNRSMTSQLISNVRQAEFGSMNANPMTEEELVSLYTQMIENDLLERLKNGIYGQNVKISHIDQIYRVMLSRALVKQKTQILYVPISLVTYIAFDYNNLGVGKSLLEETKILSGIRSMLLFSNTMAEIKNSVGRQTVKIELDPEDPDPQRTVEFLIHEYAKNRQSTFPIGASNPLDLVNFLQNAGVQVAVTGNEAYPVTTFDVEDKVSQRTEVNSNLNDDLRKRHYNAFGVPPETVDAASGAEFATTVVRNNIIFTKVVCGYQKKLEGFLEDHVRKYITNSQILMDAIRTKYDELIGKPEGLEDIRRKEVIISILIDRLTIKFPATDVSELTTQMDAYQQYSAALDEILKAYLNEDAYGELFMGETAKVITPTVAALKAYFQRKWLIEQNVLPELKAITTWSLKDGPGLNLLQEQTAHIEGLQKNLYEFMKKALEFKKQYDESLQKLTGGSDGYSGSEDAGGEGGQEDTGGFSPDTGDEEGGGGEEPSEDTSDGAEESDEGSADGEEPSEDNSAGAKEPDKEAGITPPADKPNKPGPTPTGTKPNKPGPTPTGTKPNQADTDDNSDEDDKDEDENTAKGTNEKDKGSS